MNQNHFGNQQQSLEYLRQQYPGTEDWIIEQALQQNPEMVDFETTICIVKSQYGDEGDYQTMGPQMEPQGVIGPQTREQAYSGSGRQDGGGSVVAAPTGGESSKHSLKDSIQSDSRQRKSGNPLGLKNIGQTCFINTLFQTYFMNASFVQEVLKYKFSEEQQKQMEKESALPDKKDENKQKGKEEEKVDQKEEEKKKKQKASLLLIKELQALFTKLICSNESYADARNVIESILDDGGNRINIGTQEDINQFNLAFLSCIEEGLKMQTKQKESDMDIENEPKNENNEMEIEEDKEDIPLNRRQSSIKVTDFVTKLFYGVEKYYNSHENNKQIKVDTEKAIFNTLYLQIQQKDIYSALDQLINQEINNFQNEHGDYVTMQRRWCIAQPPKTLNLCLKRFETNYNKDNNEYKSSKINDKFDFYEEIYMDKYLEVNKDRFVEIQDNIKKCKGQYKEFKEQLQNITNYKQSNIDLGKAVELTQTFLQSQLENQDQSDSTYFGAQNDQQFQNLLGTIQNYKKNVELKREDLEKKLKKLEQDIDDYNLLDKKVKYQLQSIIIHSGGVDFGHYYCYILDKQNDQKTWRKYNDQTVTEAKEEDVYTEAKGGNGVSNAYSLIYILSDQNQKQQQIPLRNYLLHEQLEKNTSQYYEWLSNGQKQEIKAQNEVFNEEMLKFKQKRLVKNIIDAYDKKFEQINAALRTFLEKTKDLNVHPPCLFNFPAQVKSTDMNEQVWKYFLLDVSYRENDTTQGTIALHQENKQNTSLLNKLEEECKKASFKYPMEIKQSDSNAITMFNLKESFQKKLLKSEVATFVMKAILSKKWQDIFCSLDHFIYICQENKYEDSYFTKLSEQLFVVVIFYALQIAEQQLKKNNYDNIVEMINLVCAFQKKHIEYPNQLQALQMENWVSELYEQMDQQKSQTKEIENLLNYFAIKELPLSLDGMFGNISDEMKELLQKKERSDDIYNMNISQKQDTIYNDLTSNFNKVRKDLRSSIRIQFWVKQEKRPLTRQEREELF